MHPSLTDEVIAMDAEAEATYAHRVREREGILQRAKEDAITLTQHAAQERDTTREAAIRAHDAAMHKMKDTALAEAHAQAEGITARAHARRTEAIAHILQTIYGENA